MNTPLNPDALEAGAKALYNEEPWQKSTYSVESHSWDEIQEEDRQAFREEAEVAVSAYLAVAQPVVNSVESLPAKMRMLAWEGGEFEVGEIPEGHVLVGFEMATDRAWSMADKVTIHIERKAATNGR